MSDLMCQHCGRNAVDPATESILSLSADRARREALRAHEALMRYGRHDDGCAQADAGADPCTCGLDAACYSPFVEDTVMDGETFQQALARKHQEHYRQCNCLGDSSECCIPACSCHAMAGESL